MVVEISINGLHNENTNNKTLLGVEPNLLYVTPRIEDTVTWKFLGRCHVGCSKEPI